MKKIAILFLTFLSCVTAYSQDAKVAFGLAFMPTTTSLSGNEVIDLYDARISFAAGTSLEYFVGPQFSLKSGLAFERKGAKAVWPYTDENGEPIGDLKTQLNYDYLIAPLAVSFSTKGRLKWYFDVGGYLGYLLRQKNTASSSVANISKQTEDFTDDAKRIDLGLSAGFGLNIPIGERWLFDVGLKGNLGLVNTSKLPIVNDGKVRTNSAGLQIGWKRKL